MHLRPRYFKPSQAALFKESCNLEDLPKIKSWPLDGGPFITLPLVYSEDP
ncbi:MAG: UbiD family decarboxylase, partial [Desulfovibrionaceae bacterium]|nr:UbiD family decarboxylase [Desulfovibrionaceae bacterium]